MAFSFSEALIFLLDDADEADILADEPSLISLHDILFSPKIFDNSAGFPAASKRYSLRLAKTTHPKRIDK